MENKKEPARVSPADSCASTVCEACGAPFSCGAQLAGCWCAEVELTEEARGSLRARYSHCLCRACLERVASGGGEKLEKILS
jgi:hypothetical protein